jgi:predicted Zn-dependent peptidase
MYEDMPQSKVSNIYDHLLYGAHPLGRTIIGSKETVQSFTRDTFVSYMKKLYHPANAVLVVAGGIGAYFKDIEKAVNKTFGGWRREDTDSSPKYPEYKPGKRRKKTTVFNKKTEQAHFILGYVTDFGFRDERKYALGSLAAILGGGMSSRLFIEVRERRGLCYYVHTTRDMFAETGSLATAVGVRCDKKTIHEAIELIRLEHQKIIEQTMNNKKLIGEDLKRVKQMLKGRFMLSLENSQAVASFYGEKLLVEGKTMTPEEAISKIDEVTIHDIRSVAQQVIRPENERLALVGPFTVKDMPSC